MNTPLAASVCDARMLATVDRLVSQKSPLHGAYFTALREGSLTRADFIRSQRQFFHAVRFFSRPMAALMARLPDSASRQTLMHNLAEEHGYEETRGDFRPSLAHDHTFIAFLESLGVPREEMGSEPEGAAARAFNMALLGTCAMAEMDLAFACLGVIEYTFADLSAQIGQSVVARGWVAQDRLVHYALHAEIDKEHAAGFFRMVEPAWEEGGSRRATVEQGLSLGLHLFYRLYEDLAELHGRSP